MKRNKYSYDDNGGVHFWLLLSWLVIGIALRFANLDAKPASSIEIATIGFSLGNGFAQIPLEKIVSESILLSPLRLDTTLNYGDVINRLMTQSTHPPLYFWLNHWWIKLFVGDGELVSLKVARSLSAILGSLAIPAIFNLSWVAFRSKLIAHLAAALMAVSPYGIYLAQEARHYTLTVLWIIISVTCVIVATHCINRHTRLPIWICCLWILVNSLGMATHYFFSLALGAEALVIIVLYFSDFNKKNKKPFSFNHWWRIIAVGLGTLAGCLVWLPLARGVSDNQLTDWIQTSYDFGHIWQPILRLIVWLITMVMLLPVENTSSIVVIFSATVILLSLIWLVPALIRGYRSSLQTEFSQPLTILINYWLGAILLYLLIIYGLGKDISLAVRYHFVYFPIVIVVTAVALANLWQTVLIKTKHDWLSNSGKKVAVVMILMGLFGSLTVVGNYGFQKSRHSDALADHIITTSTVPSIVATTYETSSQLRELIALALSFKRVNSQTKTVSDKLTISNQFLLIRQINNTEDNNFATLSKIILSQPKPLDLWGVNLKVAPENLSQLNCIEDNKSKLSDSGYKNRLYHCR